jgi:uncharacterized protein YlbG (UPF0298 family)
MYPISLHNQFIIGKTNAMFSQIQNPSKKEKNSKIYCWKRKTNVILKKIGQMTLTKTIFFSHQE